MENETKPGSSSKGGKKHRTQPYSTADRYKGKQTDTESNIEDNETGYTKVLRKKKTKATSQTANIEITPKANKTKDIEIDETTSSEATSFKNSEIDENEDPLKYSLPSNFTPNQSPKKTIPFNTTFKEKTTSILQRLTTKIYRPQTFALKVLHKQTPGKGLPEKYHQLRNYLANIKGFCKVVTPVQEKNIFKITFTSEIAANKGRKALNKY